jgi:hypothetical protein
MHYSKLSGVFLYKKYERGSMQGYIMIHRKLCDWEWYTDINTFKMFMHLLINANHKDNKFRGIDIKRGQILTGRNKLSVETGLSERQVRTTLKNLQTTNEIIVESTTKYSIITLVNYNTYQSSDQPKDLVVSNKRPTSDQRATTNNNDNNEKNDKNILVNDFFEELKNILSKNYSGTISTKLPTKKSKDKLSLLL